MRSSGWLWLGHDSLRLHWASCHPGGCNRYRSIGRATPASTELAGHWGHGTGVNVPARVSVQSSPLRGGPPVNRDAPTRVTAPVAALSEAPVAVRAPDGEVTVAVVSGAPV